MTLQIEFWQLLSALGAGLIVVVGGFWAVAQVTARQYDRLLTERFETRDKAESESKGKIDQRFDQVDQKISHLTHEDEKLADRVGELEKIVAGAPNKEDLNRIHERMDMVAKELHSLRGEFNGALDPLVRSMDRVNDYLLNRT